MSADNPPIWRVGPWKLERVRQFMARANPPEKRESRGADGRPRTEWEYPPWEFVSDKDLKEAITGTAVSSIHQKRGEMIHKALEQGPGLHEFHHLRTNVVIPEDRFDEFGSARVTSDLKVREQFCELRIGDFRLRGRTDLVLPNLIVDFKTSTRAPDWPKLATSIQWRCYAAMLDIDHFVYRHLQYAMVDQSGRRWTKHSQGVMTLRVHPPEDYDLNVGERDIVNEIHDLCVQLVEQAERLDCAGALREDRYDVIVAMRRLRRHFHGDDYISEYAREALSALVPNVIHPLLGEKLEHVARVVEGEPDIIRNAAELAASLYRLADCRQGN